MSSANTKKNSVTEENHLYNTPIDALHSAYTGGVFDKFKIYYDPCSGLGKISTFLQNNGKLCYTSDLIEYGNGDQDFIKDFLTVNKLDIPKQVECIVFNPPFKLTEEFIDHALTLCDNVIVFNRATTLETISRSKKHKSKEWPLEWFYSFGNRVSCTEGVDEKPTANAVWHGFLVYNKKYTRYPKIDWLFTK